MAVIVTILARCRWATTRVTIAHGRADWMALDGGALLLVLVGWAQTPATSGLLLRARAAVWLGSADASRRNDSRDTRCLGGLGNRMGARCGNHVWSRRTSTGSALGKRWRGVTADVQSSDVGGHHR